MLLGPPGFSWRFSFTSDFQWCCLTVQRSPAVTEHVASVESLIFMVLFVIYLFYRDDSLTS